VNTRQGGSILFCCRKRSSMSPEQAMGRTEIDARSDLYSLGVTAYEMLSGRLPFDAENPMEALTQRLTQEPRPLRAVAPNVADESRRRDRPMSSTRRCEPLARCEEPAVRTGPNGR